MYSMEDVLQVVLDNVQFHAKDMARLSSVSPFFRLIVKNQYPFYIKKYKEDTRVGRVLSKTTRSYSKTCQVCLDNKAGCFDPFTKKSVCDNCLIPVILYEKAQDKYGVNYYDMLRYDRYQYWRKVQLIKYFRLDDVKECVFYKQFK